MSKVCDNIRNAKELIIVPEVFDCASAKAAELNGFENIMISSGDFACAYTGIPDLRLLSIDEYESVTNRVTNMTDMPLILDIDDGWGRPISTYYGCKRVCKAGAAGVLVTDSRENSRPGGLGELKLVETRIKAAHDGFVDSGDSDALIIARCDVNPRTDFEEYIERSNKYLEAGANMICLCPYSVHGEGRHELAKKLGENINGWLWWPDLSSDKDGNPEFDLKDLFAWGYKMTGLHFSMHASFAAMLDAGRHVYKEKGNAYISHAYDWTGYKFGSAMAFFGLRDNEWVDREAKYCEDPDQAILKDYSKFFCRPGDVYDPDEK